MARGPNYSLKYRRRRLEKTDYTQRLGLIKSGLYRLVVRKTNNRIIAQVVKFKKGGDVNVFTVDSTKLREYDYEHNSFKNIPAAYLTGYLAGKKSLKKGIKKAVLDIGVNVSTKGNRIYSVLKGALDAGLSIPHNEKILPSSERIHGKHIKGFSIKIDKIIENINKKVGKK